MCIDISGGVELNRSVTVALSTQDGTAMCELLFIAFTDFFASGYFICCRQWFMYALNILVTFCCSRNVHSYSYYECKTLMQNKLSIHV